MALTVGCLRLQRISLWIYDCSNIRILLYGLILLAFLGQSAHGKLPDDNGLKTLSQKFADRLIEVVRSSSGSDDIQKSYQSAVSSSKMTLSSIDGQQIVTDVARRLGELLGKKITALQASVDHTEKLAEKYEWNPKLEPEDVEYVHSTEFNYSNPHLEYNDLFKAEVLMENSSVHIPVDIYSGDVEILNSLAWTAGIDDVWRANRLKDSELRWQYFGAQTGVLRMYPGAAWTGSTFGKHKVDMYDVRRRPWYTQGASSPKDMLILIDKSGSSHGQALALMKHSIKSIIDTLNENDFVNVAQFSDNAVWVGCFDTLVQANHRNKRILKSHVDSIKANGVASYSTGFRFAFEKLNEFVSNENRSEGEGAACNPMIMFLTDGGTEVPEEVFNEFNPHKRVRIFTFAVGPIANPTAAVKKIGCISRGDFYEIPAMGAIRSKVQEYVDIINQGVSSEILTLDLLQWSRSYNDEMGLELVTSVTLPVFNRSNVGNETIVGVMGIDVPVSEMMELIPKEKLGPGGYTFAIDSNGYLVFHPSLKGAEPGIHDHPGVDLVEVEEETEEMLKIRKDMIDQVAGTVTISGYVSDDDDHHTDMKRRTYYYAPVQNSPFSIGVVILEDMKSFVKNIQEVPYEEGIKALQSNILGTEIHIPFEVVCDAELENITEMTNNSMRNQYIVEFLNTNRSQCDEQKLKRILFDASMIAPVQKKLPVPEQIRQQQQDHPSDQPNEKPNDEPNEQPNEQPNDKPINDQSNAKPSDQPNIQPDAALNDQPNDQPDAALNDQPNDQPDAALNDQPDAARNDQPNDQPDAALNIQPNDQPDAKANDQPNDKLMDRPKEELQDEMKLHEQNQEADTGSDDPQRMELADDDVLMTFVTTNSGLTRLNAAENVSKNSIKALSDSPRMKNFYRRSVYNPVWMFSAVNELTDDVEDVNFTSVVVMATKSVSVQPSGFTTAVVGVQMRSERFQSLLVESMPQCGDLSLRCLLVDDGGFILYANEELDSRYKTGSFLGQAEPLLMQKLISESIFISQTTIDFQGVCKEESGGSSSALRLIPNLLYDLLTFNWWSSASTWTYLSVAGLYNWFASARANVMDEEMSTVSVSAEHHATTPESLTQYLMEIELEYLKRPKVHSCIRALYAYHLNQALSTQGSATPTNSDKQRITGEIISPCSNCSRRFGAARVPGTNMLLTYVDIDCDTLCDLLPDFKFLPEEIEDPVNEGSNCTAEFRYRRRPPCFDTNPNVNMTLETHCRASVPASQSLRVIVITSLIISTFSTLITRHWTLVLPIL